MQSMPFNGIPALINRLCKRDDIALGIVTGKSRRGVQRLLQTPHFSDRFSVSRCADDCPSKPHPAMVRECCEEIGISPINTVVIGDTGFDMEMAKAAGANAIGVSWGYHPVDRIYLSGAQQVVDDVPALEDILFSFIGPNKKPLNTPSTVSSFIGFGSLQHA
jgi:phosphoglycolate phosphatase